MKFVRMMMVAVLGLAAAVATLAAELTQENVQALMRVTDEALHKRDMDALAATLDDDMVMEFIMPAGDQPQITRMGKEEYLDSVRRSLGFTSDYVYKNENEKITISGDTAIVTSDVTESMSAGGQSMQQKSRQTTTVKLVNGKPLTVKVSVAPM